MNDLIDSLPTEVLESMGYTLENSSIYQDAIDAVLDNSQETASPIFSKNTHYTHTKDCMQ